MLELTIRPNSYTHINPLIMKLSPDSTYILLFFLALNILLGALLLTPSPCVLLSLDFGLKEPSIFLCVKYELWILQTKCKEEYSKREG
jgi:hypothetical protein